MISVTHLRQALDLIEANELPWGREWSQEHWDCGTACCIHGVAHILAYDQEAKGPPSPSDYPDADRDGLFSLFCSMGATPDLVRRFLDGDIKIGRGCRINPCATIGHRVTLEDNVVVGEHAVIGDDVYILRSAGIGHGVKVASGVIIGRDAFAYNDIENQQDANKLGDHT